MTAVDAVRPALVILADDLIWSTRLEDAAASAGAAPRRVRRLEDLEAALHEGIGLVIIDLTARAYNGLAAVRAASEAGARVIAVGQHDDRDARREALAAGAERVYAYRKLFDDGPATLRAWLEREPPGPTGDATGQRVTEEVGP